MATPIPDSHASFSVHELVQLFGAPLGDLPPDTNELTSVTTDSRAAKAGTLFVALVGERMDGHAYAKAAVERGALAVILSRDLPELAATSALRFIVADTLVAWAKLAEYTLSRFRARDERCRVFMVTGSSGKTTTKELTAAALAAALRGPCHATAGNLNNLVGAPFTLLGIAPAHAAVVVECGSNAPGEIARIADMARPHVALCMNADIAHTEGMGTVEAVADEEGSVYGFASRAVVGNADEPISLARTALARPGVRHGALNLVTAELHSAAHRHGEGADHAHPHPHEGGASHIHYRPRS